MSCKQCNGYENICDNGDEGISMECDVCISAKGSISFTGATQQRAPFGECHSVCAKITTNGHTKRFCQQWHGLNENLPQCTSEVLKVFQSWKPLFSFFETWIKFYRILH